MLGRTRMLGKYDSTCGLVCLQQITGHQGRTYGKCDYGSTQRGGISVGLCFNGMTRKRRAFSSLLFHNVYTNVHKICLLARTPHILFPSNRSSVRNEKICTEWKPAPFHLETLKQSRFSYWQPHQMSSPSSLLSPLLLSRLYCSLESTSSGASGRVSTSWLSRLWLIKEETESLSDLFNVFKSWSCHLSTSWPH